jgi:hypothetical protein
MCLRRRTHTFRLFNKVFANLKHALRLFKEETCITYI